jgi:hypothetical protein
MSRTGVGADVTDTAPSGLPGHLSNAKAEVKRLNDSSFVERADGILLRDTDCDKASSRKVQRSRQRRVFGRARRISRASVDQA